MRAVLEARRKAAVVRVEELEAELERVRTDLADAEEVLRRRVIGLEQYLEALAEEETPAVVAVVRKRPVGPRRAVPHREYAAGIEDLSVDYQAPYSACSWYWPRCSRAHPSPAPARRRPPPAAAKSRSRSSPAVFRSRLFEKDGNACPLTEVCVTIEARQRS